MLIPQLAGKQFVIKLDGRTRPIGEIAKASITNDRTVLTAVVTLTDEEAAGILGAAADKALAATPLTNSEVEDIVNGDEWAHEPAGFDSAGGVV